MIRWIVGALISASLCSNTVFASSWIRKEGSFFLAPSFNYYQASKYYNKHGNKEQIGCTFKKWETTLYGEYGLTDTTTLMFKLPYTDLKCDSSKTSGFEDIEVGFIRNINRTNKSSFSFYGNLIVPTGYSIKDNPRIGYGRFGFDSGILFGTSGNWGFVDSGLGYRYYLGYPSSQLRTYVTGAWNAIGKLQLSVTLDAEIGVGDGRIKRIGENVFLGTNYKLVQLYIGSRLMLGKRVSMTAGYKHALWGRDTGIGSSFSLGFWLSF
jgi:hypothetical protein